MDKSSGKQSKITITNDKGRLSKEEIEKMVNDAEKFRNEDETARERVVSKNNLEAYCFNMKSTLDDEKFKGKIDDDERKTIADKCDETIRWLDGNQQAEKDEFDHKQKELEDLFNPIITRIYKEAGGQQGGEGGMPGGMPGGMGGGMPPQGGAPGGAAGGSKAGPTIEEVD